MADNVQSPLFIQDLEMDVDRKITMLADFIRKSKTTLVYTGAGISTAASIPDYRGPNGVYTLASQGIEIEPVINIGETVPTVSHLVLKELLREGRVHHILSQNCDGLHLRSGIPQKLLSEIHGNMYIEVCTPCNKQYIRDMDVTRDSRFLHHATGRFCDNCSTELSDTIVHFGEVSKHIFPQNWIGTTEQVKEADLIICIGTSLKVLRSYKFLWPRPTAKTKLVIINLQDTAKDKFANLKITAPADMVMEKLAKKMKLSLRPYCRSCEPVLGNEEARNDVMNSFTDCVCGSPVLRFDSQGNAVKNDNIPGWWNAGIARLRRRCPKPAPPPVASTSGGYRKSARIAAIAKKRPSETKSRGRKRKCKESPFERDIRMAILDLVNDVSTAEKKNRGRRYGKKLKLEEEGYFKFEGQEPLAPPPVPQPSTSKEPQYDSEHDAQVSSSDEESNDDDPSFEVPKASLARIGMIPGNISPRRKYSIDQNPSPPEATQASPKYAVLKVEPESDDPSTSSERSCDILRQEREEELEIARRSDPNISFEDMPTYDEIVLRAFRSASHRWSIEDVAHEVQIPYEEEVQVKEEVIEEGEMEESSSRRTPSCSPEEANIKREEEVVNVKRKVDRRKKKVKDMTMLMPKEEPEDEEPFNDETPEEDDYLYKPRFTKEQIQSVLPEKLRTPQELMDALQAREEWNRMGLKAIERGIYWGNLSKEYARKHVPKYIAVRLKKMIMNKSITTELVDDALKALLKDEPRSKVTKDILIALCFDLLDEISETGEIFRAPPYRFVPTDVRHRNMAPYRPLVEKLVPYLADRTFSLTCVEDGR